MAFILPVSVAAKNTRLIFISNEKSSTITVLDGSGKVVRSFETCARPRGMHFSADRTQFYVGCADWTPSASTPENLPATSVKPVPPEKQLGTFLNT